MKVLCVEEDELQARLCHITFGKTYPVLAERSDLTYIIIGDDGNKHVVLKYRFTEGVE